MTTTRFAALLLGQALLVLGGMNLFANLLQIQGGQWQHNFALSAVLMLVFAGVPAGLGAWLVMGATGGNGPFAKGGKKQAHDGP
jgi:hypothetical protein